MICHPAASAFPLMSMAELERLAEDIRSRGQVEPIIVHEGRVLDGRNRLAACQIAGVEPVFEEWEGADPAAYVVSRNLARRHLTRSQRAMAASRLALLPGYRSPVGHGGVSQPDAAARFNVGRHSVQRARKVQTRGISSLGAAVDAGRLTVTVAARVAAHPAAVQRRFMRAVEDEGLAPREALRRVLTRAVWRGDPRRAQVERCALSEAACPPVDLVLTASSEWSALGEFCARSLREGGRLACVSTQEAIPRALGELRDLVFERVVCAMLPRASSVYETWTPVLCWSRGEAATVPEQVVRCELDQVSLRRALVEALCPKGGSVADPACGTGDTGVAARGRVFFGFEADARKMLVARARTR